MEGLNVSEIIHDNYKRIEGEGIRRCPCCGSPAELWQYSTSPTSPTNKVVMCSNNLAVIETPNDLLTADCPMFMPPQLFYKATAREAIDFWVRYGEALEALQRKNRWAEHNVLR